MRRQVEEPTPGREAAREEPCDRRSGWCHAAWPPTAPVRYALLIAGFLLLTILMTWPLVRHAGSAVQDHGDPLYDIWSMRWFQHQALADPARLWDANILHPYERTFVFSEPQLSTALLGWPILLATRNDVLTYNLLLLASFVVLGVGVALLVEEWGGNLGAGALAGILASYTPYRYGHISHLNLLSYGWLPLALWALSRYCRQRRARDAVLAALFLTVQVLASDTLAALALGAVVLLLPIALWPVRRASPRVLATLGGSLAMPLLALLPLIIVRLEVNRRYAFARDLATVRDFAATPATYLSVGPFNHLWRGILPEAYPGPLFAGAVTLGLAALAAPLALLWRPRWAAYALGLLLVGGILSLGPQVSLGAWTVPLPYRWLHAVVPGMASMRDPGRFGILALLGLQLLAGLGAAALWAWVRPLLPAGAATRSGAAVLALLGVAALAEFRSEMPAVPVPRDPATVAVYDWLRGQPSGAVFELPANGLLLDEPRTIRQMYHSTRHWHPLVAGYTSYYPAGYLEFLLTFHGGPEALRERRDISGVSGANVGLLQDLGVRYVVLHQGGPYDWRRALAEAERLPELAHLAEVGDAVVYELDPGQRIPVAFALAAPGRAAAGGRVVAAVVARNDNPTSAVRLGDVPPGVRFTWRDARGTVVGTGEVPVTVSVVEPGGTAVPVALTAPAAPGEYRLELGFGALAAPLATAVVVGAAEHAGPDAPPLALTAASGAGGSARPGEVVSLLVEWQVRGRMTSDYTATAQLLGPDGRLVSQSDAPPFRGIYPTTAWPPGAALAQPLVVRVPPDAPPGPYRLLVALYDATAPQQSRLPLLLPDGTTATEAPLGPLLVVPP